MIKDDENRLFNQHISRGVLYLRTSQLVIRKTSRIYLNDNFRKFNPETASTYPQSQQ